MYGAKVTIPAPLVAVCSLASWSDRSRPPLIPSPSAALNGRFFMMGWNLSTASDSVTISSLVSVISDGRTTSHPDPRYGSSSWSYSSRWDMDGSLKTARAPSGKATGNSRRAFGSGTLSSGYFLGSCGGVGGRIGGRGIGA